MNQSLSTSLLLTAALAGPAMAQQASSDGPGPGARPNLNLAIDAWRQTNGQSWQAHANRVTGYLEMLYGGSAEPAFRPQADEDWYTLARDFVQQTYGMHQIHGGTLVDDRVLFLPLGQVNTTDKMTVRMRQEVNGVPVIDGWVNVLFTPEGDLLSIQNTALQLLPGTSTTPAIAAETVERSAADIFRRGQTVAPQDVSAAELAFARIDGGARLVWSVDVRNDDGRFAFRYIFDAQNGQLVDTQNLVHNFDVGGTVSTNATPGVLPDTAGNPEVVQPLPLARVTSSAGTVFTDENGVFNYPGVNTPLSVTIEYRGQYYQVLNSAGAEHTITTNAAVGQGNNLLLNPTSNNSNTGAANAYLGSHATRGLIKSVNPMDNTGDFNIVANVNLNDTCNAFFNGGSINFYPAGGGCVNTSYSTVVAHELGHWLNVLYGTGNGSDGMGEGNADMFAMYTYDAAIVGQNFFGSGNIRNGNNTRQYCGDGNNGCHGGVHANGEVWMGAGWKIRRNLNTTHGNAMGDMIANNLLMGWMNGYNQTQIDSIIETQWLTLDDDDGNIGNGSPNYSDIDSAFREQGFPGVDLQLFDFVSLSQVADTDNDTSPQTVDATVAGNFGNTVTSVTLNYSVNGGALQMASMSNVGGDNWQGDIPAIPSPAQVEYHITASDNSANSADFPGATSRPSYLVGLLTPLLVTDFEPVGNDEGWTAGAAGDTATTGVWVRVDPRGTAAQPEDDHTPGSAIRAWVTGQGPVGGGLGDNDVDGGVTTLLSPIFDGTVGAMLPVSYWRWYSNNTGGAPNADTFRVGVSNDGGSSWFNVEAVGPGGTESNGGWFQHSVDLATIITPTANMQLRFRASDLDTGSIVEAAIDDIQLVGLSESDSCEAPSSYCVGAPNSSGSGAAISMFGSQSIADNDFNLFVEQAPGNKSGLFFYGQTQGQVTFGDGFRCITGVTYRLNPLAQTDGLGEATRSVDLTNPPAPGGQILVGSTWNFQFWFRDPTGPGGTGFNLTDGVSVPFCE